MTPAPIILCLASKRTSGGSSAVPASSCPPVGTTGAAALYADSWFNPWTYDGWEQPGAGAPDDFTGVENAYGAPDSTSWVAYIAPEPENPFDAAVGFGLDAYTPEYPACAQAITGGTVEIAFTDLSGSGSVSSLVGAALLIDAGNTSVYLGATSGTGAQTISVAIPAAWAQQIAVGNSPGVVLGFYRDGAVATVANIDAVTVTINWEMV